MGRDWRGGGGREVKRHGEKMGGGGRETQTRDG